MASKRKALLDDKQMELAVQYLAALRMVYERGGTAVLEVDMVDGAKVRCEVRRALAARKGKVKRGK